MEMLEPELEKLLLNKSFEELKPEERAYVKKHLNEAEYTNYHFLLIHAVDALAIEGKDMVPPPFLHSKSSSFTGIFREPVFYRAIAATGIAAVLFFVLLRHNETPVQLPKLNQNAVTAKISQPLPVQKKFFKAIPITHHSIKQKTTRVALVQTAQPTGSSVASTDELLGLDVQTPFLCLDMDVNEQVPGLNEGLSTSN